jgi:CBS domain-containing protein
MKVREIVDRFPISVSPNLSVCEAAHVMEETGCAFLPVVDQNVPVGVVTDRDLAIRVTGAGLNPTHVFVSEVMSTPPMCVEADLEAEEAAQWMLARNVKRLLVVQAGKLSGILTVLDLTGYITDESMVSVLHSMSERNQPRAVEHFASPMPEVYVG